MNNNNNNNPFGIPNQPFANAVKVNNYFLDRNQPNGLIHTLSIALSNYKKFTINPNINQIQQLIGEKGNITNKKLLNQKSKFDTAETNLKTRGDKLIKLVIFIFSYFCFCFTKFCFTKFYFKKKHREINLWFEAVAYYRQMKNQYILYYQTNKIQTEQKEIFNEEKKQIEKKIQALKKKKQLARSGILQLPGPIIEEISDEDSDELLSDDEDLPEKRLTANGFF